MSECFIDFNLGKKKKNQKPAVRFIIAFKIRECCIITRSWLWCVRFKNGTGGEPCAVLAKLRVIVSSWCRYGSPWGSAVVLVIPSLFTGGKVRKMLVGMEAAQLPELCGRSSMCPGLCTTSMNALGEPKYSSYLWCLVQLGPGLPHPKADFWQIYVSQWSCHLRTKDTATCHILAAALRACLCCNLTEVKKRSWWSIGTHQWGSLWKKKSCSSSTNLSYNPHTVKILTDFSVKFPLLEL